MFAQQLNYRGLFLIVIQDAMTQHQWNLASCILKSHIAERNYGAWNASALATLQQKALWEELPKIVLSAVTYFDHLYRYICNGKRFKHWKQIFLIYFAIDYLGSALLNIIQAIPCNDGIRPTVIDKS